jgi:hypothetical protein
MLHLNPRSSHFANKNCAATMLSRGEVAFSETQENEYLRRILSARIRYNAE